jgi:DNA-binding NtrC family response regulator
MDDHTESPGRVVRDGRIIVAVTILEPNDLREDATTSQADPWRSAVEGPLDLLQAGSANGLHEALRQAILRVGHLPEPEGNATGVATPSQSDWERLVEIGLRSRPRDLYSEALAAMERQLLIRVLNHAGGNQTQAALILGITRGCLRAKIRTLGITIGHSVRSENDQVGQRATSDEPHETPDRGLEAG